MKKVLALLFMTFFLAAGTLPASCLAYEPQRIAVLPVFNSSDTHDQDTEQVIADALQAKFHMPLAKVITIYDVIPAKEVQLALPPELQNRNKPGKINAAVLQKIGTSLQADIVIGAQITNFTAVTFSNRDGDLFQRTDLTIRIVGYDVGKNQFLDIHDSRDYDGDWSVMGNPDYLAKQIMEDLMGKVPYTWKR
ncbi:MAG: hypothetical protein ABFC84_09930 [Veillonellales bacterium]